MLSISTIGNSQLGAKGDWWDPRTYVDSVASSGGGGTSAASAASGTHQREWYENVLEAIFGGFGRGLTQGSQGGGGQTYYPPPPPKSFFDSPTNVLLLGGAVVIGGIVLVKALGSKKS